MTTVLLAVYLLGVLVFLLTERESVLGGWFQFLVTALLWPMVVIFVLIAYRKGD